MEWGRRVSAEANSACSSESLALALDALSMSEWAERARLMAAQERRHAQLSAEVFRLAGGSLPNDRSSALRPMHTPAAPLAESVSRTFVELCLGETLAVPLFARLRARCSVQLARDALTEILRDEVSHRALGWELLEALLAGAHAARVRSQLEATVPNELERLCSAMRGAAQSPLAVSEADLAWGLMPTSDYAEALEETLIDTWRPRLTAYGLLTA
jgi:hypothetical protein